MGNRSTSSSSPHSRKIQADRIASVVEPAVRDPPPVMTDEFKEHLLSSALLITGVCHDVAVLSLDERWLVLNKPIHEMGRFPEPAYSVDSIGLTTVSICLHSPEMYFYDFVRNTLIRRLQKHEGPVFDQTFLRRHSLLASVSPSDPRVCLWRIDPDDEFAKSRFEAFLPLSVSGYSPNRVISGDACPNSLFFVFWSHCEIWDVERLASVGKLRSPGTELRLSCLALGPKGKLAASGGADECLRIWDLRTREIAGCFNPGCGDIRAILWPLSPNSDGKVVLATAHSLLVCDVRFLGSEVNRFGQGNWVSYSGVLEVGNDRFISSNFEHRVMWKYDGKLIQKWDLRGAGSGMAYYPGKGANCFSVQETGERISFLSQFDLVGLLVVSFGSSVVRIARSLLVVV